jgi:hypothetical protein
VTWLNEEVRKLQIEEPQRQVAIVTHHCPTTDARAIDPRHQGSSMSTAFATDLSAELCWTSPAVKLWAFGHTHCSCAFHEENSGKLILANQRGYSNALDARQRAKKVPAKVVEAGSVSVPRNKMFHFLAMTLGHVGWYRDFSRFILLTLISRTCGKSSMLRRILR